MKLIIIRHGDPDYEIDSLTEKGWKEAELAARKLKNMKIDHIYVSPLGRAKDTCAVTEHAIGMKAVEKEWLCEFMTEQRPEMLKAGYHVVWDQLPYEWTKEPRYFQVDQWYNTPFMKRWGTKEEYERVTRAFDELLKEHGYEREGNYYKVNEANDKTIVFFCHFALEVVLLAHLMNISPMPLWHGFCAAPSSMTTIYSEERRKGAAFFRAAQMGDISHLYVEKEEPSFAARFCEMYDNFEERHD